MDAKFYEAPGVPVNEIPLNEKDRKLIFDINRLGNYAPGVEHSIYRGGPTVCVHKDIEPSHKNLGHLVTEDYKNHTVVEVHSKIPGYNYLIPSYLVLSRDTVSGQQVITRRPAKGLFGPEIRDLIHAKAGEYENNGGEEKGFLKRFSFLRGNRHARNQQSSVQLT